MSLALSLCEPEMMHVFLLHLCMIMMHVENGNGRMDEQMNGRLNSRSMTNVLAFFFRKLYNKFLQDNLSDK